MNFSTRKPPGQRRLPDDGAESFWRAVRLMVAAGRQQCQDDATIRADVTRAFRQAVTNAGPWKIVQEVEGRGPMETVSSAGIFRLVMEHLGIDDQRADERQQETWWTIVGRAIDETLALDEGDFRRRPAME